MVEDRHQPGWALPLAVAAWTLLGGCFTGPINRPPETPTIAALDTVRRGEPAAFTINHRDPDGDPVTVTWGWHQGECPEDFIGPIPEDWNIRALPLTADTRARVDTNVTNAPFCICAVAADNHGATSTDCFWADPKNTPPIADIKVLEPRSAGTYALYSNFRLSGLDSFDPVDQLKFSWTFTRPPSSRATRTDCPNDPENKQFCFTADVEGDYLLLLEVNDDHGGTDTARKGLTVVGDRLPCIRETIPVVTQVVLPPPLNNEFSVEVVDDDGEPFPQQPGRPLPHFAWSIRHGDEPWVKLQGIDFHRLPVAPTEFPGPVLGQIRVEINDDSIANQRTIRDQLSTCSDQPNCNAAPGCLVRVTWTVQY